MPHSPFAVIINGRVSGLPAHCYVRATDELPSIGTTSEVDDPMVKVKLFTPTAGWTWYLIECDPETGEAFGLVDGHEVELGYIDLCVIASEPVGRTIALHVERDLHWRPRPLSEVRQSCERRRCAS